MSLKEFREQHRVPMWCPICNYIMKGSISTKTYNKHGCCANCFIAFIDGREERWQSGWRPSDDEVEAYYARLHKR